MYFHLDKALVEGAYKRPEKFYKEDLIKLFNCNLYDPQILLGR